MKTFYLDRACLRAASLAVALSLATAANLTAQDKTSVVCADGFVATSVAICNASHHGLAPTTIGASSPAGTDNPFSAATTGLPDAGGTSSKPPVVFTKETGSASPTIWQSAVTGESLDTATKSGGITKTTGTELNAFKFGTQSPVDTQSTKPKGKRQGQPVVP